MITQCIDKIFSGEELTRADALQLIRRYKASELSAAADRVREHFHGRQLDLCSIANAKSGKCSEDCHFCAQSSHYPTEVTTYDIIETDRLLQLARENDGAGVQRFSLVTAGHSLTKGQLSRFQKLYAVLRDNTGMQFCASMGFLTEEKAGLLKKMGVTRYHCNLETCKSYFPKICTTHTWEDKAATIRIAMQAGLEVCSGGIIGLGETVEQRLELAFELRELGVLSIPVNILTPIKKTPFEDITPLTADEVLGCVSLFRLVNPQAVIRIAGGRNILGSAQEQFFLSGANGAIVGNYLTTSGNDLAADMAMFKKLGFSLRSRN